MHLPEIVRSNTFRWAITVAGVFSIFIIALFSFIDLRTDRYLTSRSDVVIAAQLDAIATLPDEKRLDAIAERLRQDPRWVQLVGLFGADRHRIAGNVDGLPPDLRIDAGVTSAELERTDQNGRRIQVARVIARTLTNGDILVIGRNVDEVRGVGYVVREALVLGLLPALCLCLMAGAILSLRAQRRVEEVNERVQRIIAGDLRERLPHQRADDPFSKLATIVNGMLDEIETLVQALAGVGNDIAHDLRTPLTRARLTLERGRTNAQTLEQLQGAADKAIAGIDQSLTIVTALLRLAEIENSRRSSGFGKVALQELLREVGDLYEPIAENKHIALHIYAPQELIVDGDRDLIIEALANLVDNAVKFTPEGGRVDVELVRRMNDSVVRVMDSGPGINDDERGAVMRRFYRSDKMRNTPGVGLGLNLVAAIIRLHGFRFAILPGPGCVVEIACPDVPV
jgi:signal transduction histidine kinase